MRDTRQFVLVLLMVILAEWLLWLLYRYLSYPFIKGTSTYEGFLFHIIFAPLIGLTPLIIYWRFIRKEKGTPWAFTRKRLFSSVLIGAVAAAVLMILYQLFTWTILAVSGYGDPARTVLFSDWRASEAVLFLLMTFTYFFVVGPVEELQYRSFLQDQLGRVMVPWRSLIIASALFALAHLPVYIIVYELPPSGVLFALSWTLTMGSVFGLFYFWSRNIMGAIIMHGFWDWVLSVWSIRMFRSGELDEGGIVGSMLWVAAIIPAALVTCFFIYAFYRGFWKGSRPDGSLGLNPPRFIRGWGDGLGRFFKGSALISWIGDLDVRDVNVRRGVARSVLSVIIVMALVMLLSAPGTTDVGYLAWEYGDEYQGGGDQAKEADPVNKTYTNLFYVAEGEEKVYSIPLNETSGVLEVSVRVNWKDEDTSERFVNAPDTFSARMMLSNREVIEEGPSDGGILVLNWMNETAVPGTVDISVTCEEAGNISPVFGLLGMRDREDAGNDVTVTVSATYYNEVF